MTKNLWEVVAQTLGTGHSAWECNHQFVLATSRPSRRRRGGGGGIGTKEDATPPAITAKVGTMKRKRQLRNALEHLDKGYSDDIFDSTPFRKKVKSVSVGNCLVLAEAIAIDNVQFLCSFQVPDLSDEDSEGSKTESRPITTPSEAKRKLGAPTSIFKTQNHMM